MRVIIAMVKHETNTFSPVPTPLERFGDGGPYWGAAAIGQYKGTATSMGAYIALAEERGAEIVTPVAGEAWPSGLVHDDAFEAMIAPILEAVGSGCDAILLDLHGAMVTQSHPDGEGALVARIREAAPDVPIGVALDFHGNLTDLLIDSADVVAGYKTYPHVDMYETGEAVGRTILALVEGTAPAQAIAWGNRPMIPHIMRQGTHEPPMADLIDLTREAEAAGCRIASVFGGFPHADIHDAGLSAVVVADDTALATHWCDRILDAAWERRADFVYRGEPLETAVSRAKGISEGPVLMLDHSDNCGSGGSQDVMVVIAEILRQQVSGCVCFAVHDPEAVDTMIAAGEGADVSLSLGGKYDLPAIGLTGTPLAVTGTVKHISDGHYTIEGPMYTGVRVNMGRAVVLTVGDVDIVVIDRHHEPWDAGCLRALGYDPATLGHIMLKSRVHWRAGFGPLIRHVVPCDGVGVTTSDYSLLTFENLRRPIYPLDPMGA